MSLGLHPRNLLTQKLVMRPHPKQPLAQTMRHRRAILQPQLVELLGKLAQARQPYPLATEQPLDTGCGTSALSILKIRVPSMRHFDDTKVHQGGFPCKKSILFA